VDLGERLVEIALKGFLRGELGRRVGDAQIVHDVEKVTIMSTFSASRLLAASSAAFRSSLVSRT